MTPYHKRRRWLTNVRAAARRLVWHGDEGIGVCEGCHKVLLYLYLQVHHRRPLARIVARLGYTPAARQSANSRANLQVMCVWCHAKLEGRTFPEAECDNA